jgi:hypothetical protein
MPVYCQKDKEVTVSDDCQSFLISPGNLMRDGTKIDAPYTAVSSGTKRHCTHMAHMTHVHAVGIFAPSLAQRGNRSCDRLP